MLPIIDEEVIEKILSEAMQDIHSWRKKMIHYIKEENPEKAIENFRECLRRINSREKYNAFLNAGFPVILRDERRSIDETLRMAEEVFRLK